MLSTSKLIGFNLSEPKPNDKLYKKSKFTPHMISAYEQHKNELGQHVYELKKKYPFAEVEYIKSLLEELQNNVEMVSQIIQHDHKKAVKHSMEQERGQNESIINQERKQKNQPLKAQDIKKLQTSLLKLYKKLSDEKKQKQQLAAKVAALSKQNQNLKLLNQQLLGQQMKEMDFLKNLDIC